VHERTHTCAFHRVRVTERIKLNEESLKPHASHTHMTKYVFEYISEEKVDERISLDSRHFILDLDFYVLNLKNVLSSLLMHIKLKTVEKSH